MTREEIIDGLKFTVDMFLFDPSTGEIYTEPGNDNDMDKITIDACKGAIELLEQEPKTGHCKDCKWWKDSDGIYRRGCGAESQCPINRREVLEGNGYCFLFEPQAEVISDANMKMWEEIFEAESEDKE